MTQSLSPSKVRDEYWVHAVNSFGHKDWTDRSGKWLLFIPSQKIDEIWVLISGETVAGRLGIASKAATAKRNPLARNSWMKVICIYTYDSVDVEDVMRVRQRLREIGFTKKLSYKTDGATRQGVYATGSERVSLFCE
jgi:hypothetical protein